MDESEASFFSDLPLWAQTILRIFVVMVFQEVTKRWIRQLMGKVHAYSQQDAGAIKKTALLLPRIAVTAGVLVFIVIITCARPSLARRQRSRPRGPDGACAQDLLLAAPERVAVRVRARQHHPALRHGDAHQRSLRRHWPLRLHHARRRARNPKAKTIPPR